jgi:hypothetical protein
VTHGDIKPENILIDGAGNAFLSDFAIASDARQRVGSGALERTLRSPYASPEQFTGEVASSAGDVYSLGAVLAQALTGLTGEPAQIRGALSPAVARVIDRATEPDPAGRYADVTAFAQELLQELVGGGQPAELAQVGEVENPYKGLRPFEQTDADQFFGRDRLVDRLVARLGEQGPRGRFIAVVGPSGSGKSSVVKAGLLPALRKGALPASDEWFVVDMTPAPRPFEELEGALSRVAIDPPGTLLEQLAGKPSGLRRVVRQVLPEGSQLVLVVDQFEELFTQVDADQALRFVDALVEAVRNPHANIRVVATLRADFYDRPLRHRGLGELLREGTEVITPMSPEELEQAITGPAATVGVMFEPALVAELVTDVVDRPGALPLLQYTLTELFEGRSSATILLNDYHSVGGVSGALVSRADGLLAGLSPAAADAARQVFLRLVTLGEGAEDTRRRVLIAELRQLLVAPQDLDQILDTFGRHRLLSFDRDPITRGPTVEISHEALLTQWKRLRNWVDEARHDVRNQRRLAQALSEWVSAGRVDEYLLGGGQLDQLAGWAATTSLPLSVPESQFLEASLAERDRVDRQERKREERATEAEQSARRRLRLLSVVGIAATVIAVLAVFAFVQRQAARESEATVEQSRRALALASEANLALFEDPELSLILAVEAARATAADGFATPEAVDALHWAIQENGVAYPADNTTPVAVRSAPRGARGVFVIPPTELAAIATGATDRVFSEEECARLFPDVTCPDPAIALPSGITIYGGNELYGARENVPGALAGTTVEFLVPLDQGDTWSEFQRFYSETGIYAEHVTTIALDETKRRQAEGLARPDIIYVSQPVALVDLGRQGLMLDLSASLDIGRLRDDFGSHLMEHVTVASGSVFGFPVEIDLKGLIFYPRSAFESAGYRVPETWDDLMALSHQMVADGRTPWCVGFSSPPADGWPGTDWLESLVLREAGPTIYDDWVAHRVPFDTQAVRSAAARLDELVSTPGFVWLGKERISQLGALDDIPLELERDDPSCWMLHQGDFMLGFFSPDTQLGQDIDFFVLPPIDPSSPTPVLGGGAYVGALADRPEVRALLEHLASPRWGEMWARQPGSTFLSPNARFDTNQYGADAGESERAIRAPLGTATRDAVAAGVWRFDASDLMPVAIGSLKGGGEGPEPGLFFQGMVDYVDGKRSIEQVLIDIEAAWVALETGES